MTPIAGTGPSAIGLGKALATLIVGYGNEIRGDDGLGPWIAAQIARLELPDVRVTIMQQLVPELAVELAIVDRAIFIDARCDDESNPVRIEVIASPTKGANSAAELASAALSAPRVVGHRGDPVDLLALTRSAYDREPFAWLVSVHGEEFAIGQALSAAAIANARSAVVAVRQLLVSPNAAR